MTQEFAFAIRSSILVFAGFANSSFGYGRVFSGALLAVATRPALYQLAPSPLSFSRGYSTLIVFLY